MSKVICIAGESGSGKTTSMRNLDPETTMYIDCDKKGLSWKGWRNQYNGEKKNYLKTDFPQVALQALKKIDKEEQYKHRAAGICSTGQYDRSGTDSGKSQGDRLCNIIW